MGRRFDAIEFVESSYRFDTSDVDWLDLLVASGAAGLEQGLGVGATAWRLCDDHVQVDLVRGAMDRALLELVPSTYEGLPARLAARYLSGPPLVSRLSDDPEAHAFMLERTRGVQQICDVIGGQVGDGRGHGVTFSAFCPTRGHFDRARRGTWLRLMSHVGAGLRLRTAPHRQVRAPAAVLTPEGRVCHAEGEAKKLDGRAALIAAVRSMERARGPLRRTSPDDALAAWRALVLGTWSVVDWIDVDARRYLVAFENRLDVADPRALNAREREVAEYIVHGRSASEIAYALGLRLASVESATRSVLRKLGQASRTDLASLFGGGLEATRLDGDLVVLAPERRYTQHWAALSNSLRDVVAMAIHGASNAEIARARGCSVRTIANQLSCVYERFGVRGRSELAALFGGVPRRAERGSHVDV